MIRLLDHPLVKIAFFCSLIGLVAFMGQSRLVTSYRVSGNSMQPSFEDGDRVIVAVLPSFLTSFGDGDTVIAEVRGETLIKRIVGIPGDMIEIREGRLWRNGARIEEEIPDQYVRGCGTYPPRRLARGQYFLLGDHRRVSIDSREFGPVHRECLVGEVVWRLPGAATPGTASMAMEE